MKDFKFLGLILITILINFNLTSCTDEDDASSNKEHDGTLYGEWIETTGGQYVKDYYYFSSDGTGIHGSYELDIDLINEDDDINWYTVDRKFLYINGKKCEYWCDGTSLEIEQNGKTKKYREK